MKWSQKPSQTNRDNVQNVRRQASRTFRTRTREYPKDKINELQQKNKNNSDLYKGIN